MSIFVDEKTRVVYQGLTGSAGRFYGLLRQKLGWGLPLVPTP